MITTHAFHGTGQHLLLNRNNIDTSTDVTIYLSGEFASITFFHLGNFANTVQVMPVQDETVKAYKLTCYQCNNLKITGLGRMEISGTTLEANANPYQPIVLLEGNNCSIEGAKVCSTHEDNWAPDDWQRLARNGIQLSGYACFARFNEVFNVRNGIEVRAQYGRAIGNHVSNFYGDGLRALADYVTLANNHISYARDSGSDRVHSDGIQMWNFYASSPGEGILTGVSILYNAIWNHSEKPGSRLMQGIGCFDGLLRDAKIIGNVVMTDHYHGITLGIAQNSRIEENSVISTNPAKVKSWIKIGTNKPTDFVSSGNALSFNESAKYLFEPGMVEQNIANNTLPDTGEQLIDDMAERQVA